MHCESKDVVVTAVEGRGDGSDSGMAPLLPSPPINDGGSDEGDTHHIHGGGGSGGNKDEGDTNNDDN